jgi:hypothetical protein
MNVRMPDGTLVRNVPEGTSKDEILRKLAASRGEPAAPAAPAEPTEGGWEQFGGGIAHAGKEAYRGVKGLVGGDTAELEQQAKEYAAKPKGWQAGAGEFVGNVGMLAPLAFVPGGLGVQAALAAGSSAAITPGSASERLTAGALGAGGAALGGAIPGALKLARGAARGVGEVGERAAAALPGALGERAAERVGGRQTARYLERELGDVPVGPDVYTPDPRLAAAGARPSAAVATQDARIAGMQRRSEAAVPEAWAPHEAQQARAQFGALEGGLQKQTDLDDLLQQANKIGSEVEGVYEKAGPAHFDNEMDKFYDLIKTTKTTAEYHGKPTVQAAVDYIEKTMKSAGVVTPKLLHMMKQTVAGGLKGVPGIGDEGVRATASEPFVRSLTAAMDRVLDRATKSRYAPEGKYSQWKRDYAEAMTKAEGAKADINVMSRFIDPATGLPRKATVGLDDVPVITPQGLKQAIAASGSLKRGPRKGQNVLRPESQEVMEAVLRDAEAQQIVSRIPRAAAPQSGAATLSDFAKLAATELLLPTGFGLTRYAVNQGGQAGKKAMERQLAELLQDPQRLRQFLKAQEQRRLLRAQPAGRLPGGGAVGAAAPLMLGGPE